MGRRFKKPAKGVSYDEILSHAKEFAKKSGPTTPMPIISSGNKLPASYQDLLNNARKYAKKMPQTQTESPNAKMGRRFKKPAKIGREAGIVTHAKEFAKKSGPTTPMPIISSGNKIPASYQDLLNNARKNAKK